MLPWRLQAHGGFSNGRVVLVSLTTRPRGVGIFGSGPLTDSPDAPYAYSLAKAPTMLAPATGATDQGHGSVDSPLPCPTQQLGQPGLDVRSTVTEFA
jgi:hypothetical protein